MTSPTDVAITRSSSRRAELGLGILLFLGLLAVNAIAGRQTQQLHDDAQLMIHTHEVMEALDDLLVTVKDAESGQRGYLLTGEERYLKSYNTAIAATKEKIGHIEQLIKNSPLEERRMPPLQTAINLEVEELAESVAVRQLPNFDSARLIALTDHEAQTMGTVENEVHALQDLERGVLENEEQSSEKDYRWAVITIGTSLVLVLALFAACFGLLCRHAAERREALLTPPA